jgi:ubiquinone/menaquinone biosynthesis C-methylase UbiE
MNHARVNQQFVDDLVDTGPVGPNVIDLGCGPADIPIRLLDRLPNLRLIGIDNTPEMLAIAKSDVDTAGLNDRITLQQSDASNRTNFDAIIADTVISNSFLHHLDDPKSGINVAVDLLKPGGRLFVRDLLRPSSIAQIESLVAQHGQGEPEPSRQLLRQSLHAALTLEESIDMVKDLGIPSDRIRVTSDRHWTMDWTKC